MATDDFEEGIRRAAREHAKKVEALDLAQKKRQAEQAEFLVAFADWARKMVKPILDRAAQTINSERLVSAEVRFLDTKEMIGLSMVASKTTSILLFVADPSRLRVAIRRSSWSEGDKDAENEIIWHIRNSLSQSPVAFSLDQLDEAAVGERVQGFVITSFG